MGILLKSLGSLMPFTTDQKYKALTHLNKALIRTAPYASAARPDWQTYDPKLNPAEYYAGQMVPRLFVFADISARMDVIGVVDALVTDVVEIITELDALNTRISTLVGSGSGAMIRADVVEWLPGQTVTDVFGRQAEIIEYLRMHLSLPPTPRVEAAYLGRS